MGSHVHVIVVGGDAEHLDLAATRVDELERRWSRFVPTSEVCRINAAAGHAEAVSPDTVLLVARAVEAWQLTGGAFDPTLLDALEQAGYDRTFADLVDREAGERLAPMLAVDRPAPSDIRVGEGAVCLPPGVRFDPGGIGKGLAADLVAELLLAEGAGGALVNLGGDVRVAGLGPTGAAWTVGIEHPAATEPIALVGLRSGAVATSTILKRSWRVGDEVRHHLIDPHTGWPTDSDVALASVIAGEGWQAEVLAKAALLRGADRAFDLLIDGTAGLVVGRDGTVHVSATFTTYTGGVAPHGPIGAR